MKHQLAVDSSTVLPPFDRSFFFFNKTNGLDVENPKNFLNRKTVLTVVWGSRATDMVNDPIMFTECFTHQLYLTTKYCPWRLFVHPSLYVTLKLAFPSDSSVLSPDGTIRAEMGTGSTGEAVDVLTLLMFNAEEQL